jgi:hypothetical protein
MVIGFAPLLLEKMPKSERVKMQEVPAVTGFAPVYKLAQKSGANQCCASAPLAPPPLGWRSGAAHLAQAKSTTSFFLVCNLWSHPRQARRFSGRWSGPKKENEEALAEANN